MNHFINNFQWRRLAYNVNSIQRVIWIGVSNNRLENARFIPEM